MFQRYLLCVLGRISWGSIELFENKFSKLKTMIVPMQATNWRQPVRCWGMHVFVAKLRIPIFMALLSHASHTNERVLVWSFKVIDFFSRLFIKSKSEVRGTPPPARVWPPKALRSPWSSSPNGPIVGALPSEAQRSDHPMTFATQAWTCAFTDSLPIHAWGRITIGYLVSKTCRFDSVRVELIDQHRYSLLL